MAIRSSEVPPQYPRHPSRERPLPFQQWPKRRRLRHVTFLLQQRPGALLGKEDNEALRWFLSKPVRAYRYSISNRAQLEARANRKRELALFMLYGVPADWTPDIRWTWLAWCLAGDLFAGCRTLLKPRGGRPSRRYSGQKELLFKKFDAYESEIPQGKTRRRAYEFFRKHRAECSAAGLNTDRSFYQAMTKIRQDIDRDAACG
jgi:hypothetical protein